MERLDVRDKRNVLWRACQDLQEMLDDLTLRRAKVVGERRRRRKSTIKEKVRKSARHS